MEEEKKEVVLTDDIKRAVYGVFYNDTAKIHEDVLTLKIFLKKASLVVVHDKITKQTVIMPWLKEKEE